MGRLKVLYDMIAALSEATEYQRPDHPIPIRLQAVLRRTGRDTLAGWFDKLNPATVSIGWAGDGERSTLSNPACGRYDVFAFRYV